MMIATTTIRIDLNSESGRLWMEGASADMRAKKAQRAHSFYRKTYGAKDQRTIDAKSASEVAKEAAVAAERKLREYMEIH